MSEKNTSKKKVDDKKEAEKSTKKAKSGSSKSKKKTTTTKKASSEKTTASKKKTKSKSTTKKKSDSASDKKASSPKKKPTTSKKKTKSKSTTKKSDEKATKEVKKSDIQTRKQAEVNIGTIGHVDHGKSTLVKALSGTFPDTHSEELKRGISIRLGYADTDIRYCPDCPDDAKYTTEALCPKCNKETKISRRVSFVDAPGHEVLMATLLTGAAIFDGAILVIAANEKCPQAQTREHLAAMDAVGIKNIIIVQNKVELVSEEQAMENYNEIKKFVKGTVAEGAPIIPLSAIHRANLDILIRTIEEVIKTPKRDDKVDPMMFVARSFEVNKPGTKPEDLLGGVLGGSIIQGMLKDGEEIEIRPGIISGRKVEPIVTKIQSIHAGTVGQVSEAKPGGLMSIGTNIDPSLSRADSLVGHIIGKPGKLPPIYTELNLEINLMDTVVGSEDKAKVKSLAIDEQLMLNIWTAITVGKISNIGKGNIITVELVRPVCCDKGTRVAISRRITGRFRLIGFGIVQ